MKKKLLDCSNYGKLMVLIGFLVAIPLLTILFFPSDKAYFYNFAIPAVISILFGLISCFIGKNDNDKVNERFSSMQNSSLTVLFAWIWAIVIGSLPFILSSQLSVVQSLFESVSGWTTTGLSVMDVSVTPNIFLFHRSFMQFCGGLGFVLMIVMLVLGKQSMNLYNAEGHPDKLMPNLKKTAQTIFIIYNGFLVIGIAAYRIAGMKLFDSLLHTMCALSTGGFSSKLNSIGEYNSLSIEIITIFLMLIGTTNFAILLLLIKGKIKQIFHISELRFMFVLLLIMIPLFTLSLRNMVFLNTTDAFRQSFFNVVSALSTTGYSTVSYNNMPSFIIGIQILLMLIGGGMGSTAGGIKMSRIYISLRLAVHNIKKRLFPSRKIDILYYYKAQGKTQIDTSLANDTVGFITCYLLIFIIGTLSIILSAGCTLEEGMFEFASALGTVGLSIGLTGPATANSTLIIEMIGMIFGRLEIFIILLSVYSGIKRIKSKLSKAH
jgi:trk system potassium uptake protein TrkH